MGADTFAVPSLPAGGGDASPGGVALRAARALLRTRTEDEVVATLIDVLDELGAGVGPPTGAGTTELPIDITFGLGEPLVPTGAPEVLATVAEVLPGVIEDARVAMDRTRRHTHLASSAAIDALTGVPNRRVAMRVLDRMVPGDVVVMVDLDHFKAVNDTYGHEAGDDVLRAFAAALRSVGRTADTVGRIGGEEFVLLLPNTGVEGVGVLLARLGETWRRTRPAAVTFSAGVAAVGAAGPREALRRADAALYAAKDGGRDRVEVAA